ncbi:MAG: hypothetical protein HY921_05950 [Elusimicrobia bacterium]|nr:hypothetical protein [Elusimicrobiota bacterium]
MAQYVSKRLLFPGHALNTALAQTVISPSQVLLNWPPGSWFLTYLLGKVSSMYVFLFLIQLPVPFLAFKLFRTFASAAISLLMALFLTHYCVETHWWAPDWIIQPLQLLVVLLLWEARREEKMRAFQLLLSGFIGGLIMVLKHNIGLFLGIACGAFLFVRAVRSFRLDGNSQGRPLLFAIIAGCLGFGVLFALRLPNADEVVYYTFPYFLFWGALARWAVGNKEVGLDCGAFLREAALFSGAFLCAPVLIFIWIGGAVGYGRYLYSLFGMGFKYLRIWDYGIIGVISDGFRWDRSLSFQGMARNFDAVVGGILFLVPFLVNSLIGVKAWFWVKNGARDGEGQKDMLMLSVLGIMGAFMFFPLEGYHILATKLFVYFAVSAFMIMGSASKRAQALAALALAVLVAPPAAKALARPLHYRKTPTLAGSKNVQDALGLSLSPRISQEIDKQVEVIKRSTSGEAYYVIDSSGESLSSLLAIVDNRYPQYYIEMRKGILDADASDAIIAALDQAPFVLVNSGDYEKQTLGRQEDPYLAKILKFVTENHDVVDRYEPREGASLEESDQIHRFLIMRRRRGSKTAR